MNKKQIFIRIVLNFLIFFAIWDITFYLIGFIDGTIGTLRGNILNPSSLSQTGFMTLWIGFSLLATVILMWKTKFFKNLSEKKGAQEFCLGIGYGVIIYLLSVFLSWLIFGNSNGIPDEAFITVTVKSPIIVLSIFSLFSIWKHRFAMAIAFLLAAPLVMAIFGILLAFSPTQF